MTADTSTSIEANSDGFPDLAPPERTGPALVMSLIMHVLLLTTAGLIWQQTPKGAGSEMDRPVGIALVHRLPDRDQYTEAKPKAETTEQSEQQQSESASAAAAPPADLTPPMDLTGVLQEMMDSPAPVSGTGLAGEMKLDGDAFGQERGTGSFVSAADTTAMVFGVSGSGSRFVYVFDRSDSMNGFGGKPLRAAKRELVRSIQSLTEKQRFQVIFYNDKPTPFRVGGMPLQMVSGEGGYRDLGGKVHSIDLCIRRNRTRVGP